MVGSHEFKISLVVMFRLPTSQSPIHIGTNLEANLSLPSVSPSADSWVVNFFYSSKSATSLLSALFISKICSPVIVSSILFVPMD